VFRQLVSRQDELTGAAELLEQAVVALRQDEIHVALGERLRSLAETGQRLLSRDTVPPPPPPGKRTVVAINAAGPAAQARLDALVKEVRDAIAALGDDVVVSGSIVVSEKPR
jgi:hypothetical protein